MRLTNPQQRRAMKKLLATSPRSFRTDIGVIIAVLGAQLGDEGKGKVVTYMIEHLGCTLVVRFQGGCNAGHTIYVLVDGVPKKVVLHHLPEGVAYPGVLSAIGAGCLINPQWFINEVADLAAVGITLSPDRLVIDGEATVTTCWHIREDVIRERSANSAATTQKGISGAATSITRKIRLTVDELLDYRNDYARLRKSVTLIAEDYARIKDDGYADLPVDDEVQRLIAFAEKLRQWCRLEPVDDLVYEHQRAGYHTVLVGGQGAHLDPLRSYLGTSTSIWPPLGLGTLHNMYVLGVAKMLGTALGEHPLPTKILDESLASRLRQHCGEFGATTGRNRDLYWLWINQINASIRILALDGLIFTKVDLHREEMRMATGMQVDHVSVSWWNSASVAYDRHAPNKCGARVRAAGWVDLPEITGRLAGIRRWDGLPASLHRRVLMIEGYLIRDTKVVMIGNGPNPEDIVVRGI